MSLSAQPAADSALRTLLLRQHGLLSREQALGLGVSDEALRGHVAARRWQRVHRGVYATFTGPLPWIAQVWAALLFAGDGAVASHATAARLLGLTGAEDDRIHVTIPHRRRVAAPRGVVVHRSSTAREATHPARSVPCTRIEETVLDLAGAAQRLDAALVVVAQACQQRLTTPVRLLAALDRRGPFRWRRSVQRCLADVASGAHSLLELTYLTRVERAHRLPTGIRQHRVAEAGRACSYRDVAYEEHGVVVELDGRLGHDGPRERWRDMARDNATVLDGQVVLRYGYADVLGAPCAAAAQVARVLHGRGWPGRPRRCGPRCAAT